MDLSTNDFSAKQLREWLRKLGKPTWGAKSVLVMRLKEMTPEERGTCPIVEFEDGETTADDNEEEADGDNGNEEASNADLQPGEEESDCGDEIQLELESIRKELENVRRECKLLEKENTLLRQARGGKRVAHINAQKDVSMASISLLKEIMMEYDGEVNVDIWINQFKNVGETYNADRNTLRALFVSKMKGKAQQWLQQVPLYASKHPDELLNELQIFFGNKTNKLQSRKNFENRKWNHKESFIQYCNEKILLTNALNIPEDELVEYIIDGIPDQQLRTQASLMCITTTAQLIRAFANIELQAPNRISIGKNGTGRCFNCNSYGHHALECRKPKREPGTCYVCGDKNHIATNCQQRKMPVMTVEDQEYNEYVRYFKIVLIHNPNNTIIAECLIDSGSPVCFLRLKCLEKHDLQFKKIDNEINSYVGINKSKLLIYGKIECFIEVNKRKIYFDFLIVANESMRYDAILGRNFIRECGMKLVIVNKIDNGKNTLMKCKKEYSKSPEQNYVNKNYVAISNDDNVRTFKGKSNNNNFRELRNYVNRDYDNENYGESKNETKNVNLELNTVKSGLEIKECNEFERKMLLIDLDNDTQIETIIIGPGLNCSYQKEMNRIFEEFYVKPVRPDVPKTKCELTLVLSDTKPFNCAPRRLSHTEKIELQKLLDKYLLEGIIQASSSEFASPIVLVKKKNGGMRMCIDFRKLNKVTAKDNYPLPLIEDLIEKFVNKAYFSKLDLKDAYFHVFMNPNSTKFTSFVTPLGQFEFLRMPFGLKNAPSVFQRFVNLVFNDMLRENKIAIYMDDIVLATETVEEHLEMLKKIFQRLVDNKLNLRIDKCEFLQTTITYLGYTVTKNGIKPNDKGIEAIRNFPLPQNIQAVQSFLGLCSYFRKFVKNFSLLAKPLYTLLKKNNNKKAFVFGENEIQCFELLKEKLLNSPVLAIYCPNAETELHTDASASGFGAILMQRQEKDNKMHPIFYFSKKTSETESKYHSFELETLAIIYALQRFRVYLQGIKFKIITDCNSLTLTLSKRELNPRIARWALELQNYDYTVEHRPGARMQHVDALSRNNNILVIQCNTFEENLLISQSKDTILCGIMKQLEKNEHKLYELRNGVLYRKTNKNAILFYVPKDMEIQVIHKYHNEMGHSGVNKTLDLIKQTYWFPDAKTKVEKHIQNCLKCIAYSSKNGRHEGFLQNIPKHTTPFEVLHIDHYGPIEDNSRSKKHILVIIDAFSKFVRLYPTKTTKSQECIKAMQDYFRAYSRPRCIVSDRGTCFTSSEFEEFLSSSNIQHIKIATGSPKANGQVERVNRTIGPMIAKLTDKNKQIKWEDTVPNVEYAINNTINRSVNEYPSVLLFGVRQKGNVIDELKENFINKLNPNNERNLDKIRTKAVEHQKKVQNYNKNYFDKKRKKPYNYVSGDYVMLKNFETRQTGPKKLIPKYKGPYKITKVLRHNRYIIEDVDNFQQTNIPYQGVWAAENIRPWRRSDR